MEPEGSLSCTQEPFTDPYPEPDQSSPYHPNLSLSEVVSESSRTVIAVTALVKQDERGGQGHTSESLLHQSAT
jgi:hypothetical protein